jgi:hypothetical protein
LEATIATHNKLYGTTFTNGRVSLTMDLIFGLCVMGETSWVPWSELDDTDKNLVRRLLDWCPTCPEVWRDIVYAEA